MRPYTRTATLGGFSVGFFSEHEVHLITKDANAIDGIPSGLRRDLSAQLGTTAVLDVVDEPTFFGNSRPNSISCVYKSFVESLGNDGGQSILRASEGAVRLWLYKDAARTTGAYVEIVEAIDDTQWSNAGSAMLPGAFVTRNKFFAINGSRKLLVRWGTHAGQVGERSLDCLPSAYPYREVVVDTNNFVYLRNLGYSLDDGTSPYTYNSARVMGIPVQLSVVQYHDQETATAVVHDFAGCGFAYCFDAGDSFIPAGETSPVTFSRIEISRGAARTIDGATFTPTSPAICFLDINRRTINPSREYAHSAHFPKVGQKKWGVYMARMTRKPSNPTVVFGNNSTAAPLSASGRRFASVIPFHSSDFTVERNRQLDGLFGAPDTNPVGHWTILTDDSQLVDGDLAVKIEHAPGDDAAANFAMQYTNTAFSAAFGYWLECGKADPQSRTLTHNCAQGSNPAVDLAAPQTVWISATSGNAFGTNQFLTGVNPQLTQPAEPDISGLADVVYSGPHNIQSTFDSIAAAIASESKTYRRETSSGVGFFETMPTNPFRRGELVFTLEQVQWFGRAYYPYDEKEDATWQGEGLPTSSEAVSETMAFIDSGIQRSIPVSTQRIRVDLFGMYVGRFDLQNYQTFWRAYEQDGVGFKFSNYWIEGPAIAEPRFCHRSRQFVQASYLMTKQETANFKTGAAIEIPTSNVRNVAEVSIGTRGVMFSDFLESRPFYGGGFPGGYPLTVSVKLQ